jgi:hypothetical protein
MFVKEIHATGQCTIREVTTGSQGCSHSPSTYPVAGPKAVCIALILLVAQSSSLGSAQLLHHRRPKPVQPTSTSFTFMKKDRSCVGGPITKIDPSSVTIAPSQAPALTLERVDLLQVTQNDSVLFSARSSWRDVEAVHLLAHESFLLGLRSGKTITGRPLRVTDDAMIFKRDIWLKQRLPKDQIQTVAYLRVKPNSKVFDYFTQEAPALLFFYPEYYDRLSGLEGRIPVRLYDAVMAQNDSTLTCSR